LRLCAAASKPPVCTRVDEKIPLAEFTSKEYATKLAATIQPDKATPAAVTDSSSHESTETTHFSVVDEEGNIVTNTYTLSGYYGSQVIAAGTGVLLNNHMSVFNHNPQTNIFSLPITVTSQLSQGPSFCILMVLHGLHLAHLALQRFPARS
jgi:gamma-glutamyltranspeptidase